MSNNLSSYYPAGQRILQKQGLEYNYENFLNYFENHINSIDLETIRGTNINRIEELRSKKDWWFSICKTGYNVFLKILGAIAVFFFVTLPFYLYVQNGNNIVDINLLRELIIYEGIILVCSFIATVVFEVTKIRIGRVLTAIDLKYQ